jgi:DNA repair exonuclease SbcCD ATPase subunit
MLLKQLEIMNCRKIRQAIVEFHGPGLQVIQGINQSGKTTIAQCIALSLEGPKAFTKGMIAIGEETAEVIATTDSELKIRTVIQNTIKQTVFKKNEAGKYAAISGGVRAFLDSLRSGLEMPWSMKDMTDAKIIEILKDRSGLTQKITEIDTAIKDKEVARTETGRDKKKLGTKDPIPEIKHPDPIDHIREERKAAFDYLEKEREALLKAADHIRSKCVFKSIEDIEKMNDVINNVIRVVKELLADDRVYTQADIDGLEKEIATWVEKDRKATGYDEYIRWKKEFEQCAAQYESLTQEIESLREERKKSLAGMKLGVKGLEIGDDNLLYHNGVVRGITETNRVTNWSTAESVKVFFSIGARFCGELKVIVVDNAESLDNTTTKAISEWANTAQFLVILLKVAEVPEDLEEGIIYVKNGEVLTK